ncbi:MAG: hypothetical protein WC091_16500, partial [Sulfuricellaceae bacterium]
QIFPFVVSKIFARRSKGVGKKQGLWLLFGVRLMAFIPSLWLFLPLIYMNKKLFLESLSNHEWENLILSVN